MLAENKQKIVNNCRLMIKERTGVHSSLVVALLKIDDMLGEQITAGQLTNTEKAIHAYTNHLDSFETWLGITR